MNTLHVSNKVFREYMAEKVEFPLDNFDQRAVLAYYDNIGILDDFEDSYVGIFQGNDDSEAIGEYAFQIAQDVGDLENIPTWIRGHIDWDGIGNDLRCGGECYAIELDYNTWAVFRKHCPGSVSKHLIIFKGSENVI